LDTRTAVDPAGAGVPVGAVVGAAEDGALACGVGEGSALGVDVLSELPAVAEPCAAGEDGGDAVKVRMAAMTAMATRSTDAETINVRRARAVIQHLESPGTPEPLLMEPACPVRP
jgi:hypothetical protein